MHNIGFLSHLQAVMKTGVVSLNIKKLIKRCQARCTRCRRIRLLPSNNTETPDNTMIFSNLPPFSCIQMDIAGDFKLKNQEKAYCLISVCSWSSAALLAPLKSLSASEVLQGLETSMTSIGRMSRYTRTQHHLSCLSTRPERAWRLEGWKTGSIKT